MIGTITNFFQKAGVIEVEASAGKLGVGDEYVIIGHTTGAVNGTVLELRVEDESGTATNPESVGKGDCFTLPHVGDARRGDQLYRLAPVELPTTV